MWRGLRVEYPTAMLNTEGRTSAGPLFPTEGVVVTEVAQNSAASSAGLQPGMVIIHVGGTALNSPQEFLSAVQSATGPVDLRIADDKKNPIRIIEPGS